jgi:hypothetical protein
VVDLSNGDVIRRLDLPRHEVGSPIPRAGGVAFTMTETWAVASALPDGILLVHLGARGPGEDDAMIPIVRRLELLDPVTGARSAVTAVSGDMYQVIPGGGAS